MQKRDVSKSKDAVYSQTVGMRDLPWQITLFVLLLLIPSEASFYFGTFRLTPYRIFLLLSFIPCLIKVFRSEKESILATDWLLFGFSLWIILSLTVNHDFSTALESGGIIVVESWGAYLLSRSFIRNEREFSGYSKLIIFIVIGLSFVTIPESLTGKNILRPHIGHIGGRFGFTRAFGTFDHAILYGVFCASTLSLAMYVPTRNLLEQGGNRLRTFWVLIAAFASVSSGALAAVIVQFVLAAWNRITQGMQSRWRLFSLLLMLGYFIIDLISNRSPMRVILGHLTFSPDTAYFRLIIWDWGTRFNVAVHPWFGIGFADWVRPSWMHSGSMDNYWLVIMVTYGLPAFFMLAAGILYLLFLAKRRTDLSDSAKLMRAGWGFSLIGFIISGCTVHFWNNLHSWFFFMLGSGVWLSLSSRESFDKE